MVTGHCLNKLLLKFHLWNIELFPLVQDFAFEVIGEVVWVSIATMAHEKIIHICRTSGNASKHKGGVQAAW